MKRGQVTYFIIAGLIVLIAVILIFSARLSLLKDVYEEQTAKLLGVPADIKPVEDYVQECLNDVSKTGVDFVLLQGGYYAPKEYIPLDITDVAVWYDKGSDLSPSLETIGKEVSIIDNKLLKSCINNFIKQDYGLIINNITTKVTINKANILTESNTNIDVDYKNLTFKINRNFNNKQDSDLYDVYAAAATALDIIKKNPDQIDLISLSNIGYDINFFRYNENEMVYTITTNNTNLFFGGRF